MPVEQICALHCSVEYLGFKKSDTSKNCVTYVALTNNLLPLILSHSLPAYRVMAEHCALGIARGTGGVGQDATLKILSLNRDHDQSHCQIEDIEASD